jgi:hypothetical protein
MMTGLASVWDYSITVSVILQFSYNSTEILEPVK